VRILSEGEQRAIAIGCFLAEVSLAPSKSGITAEGLPFEAGKLSARINGLVDQAQRAKKALEQENNFEKYEQLTRDGYRKLRDTWERLIEEGLFGETVRRFRNSVQTKLLKRAYIDDQDFQEVWDGITRCSNYTHDAPMDAPPPMPQPDDFIADVTRLNASHDRIVARAKQVEEKRVALVPQTSVSFNRPIGHATKTLAWLRQEEPVGVQLLQSYIPPR
jgi:hypothetical protein